MTDKAPRVLFVGAYERDNFGDLLFLLVTEPYLKGAEVVAAAPFSSDMTALLDREVPAYGPLLEQERFDVIWTVGGQVGGTDLASAYRMSADPADYARFTGAGKAERDRMLRAAVGERLPVSPYMPNPLDYPLNADAISVLNSVGLAGIKGAKPERRSRLVALVRGTDFVSARDAESGDYLTSLGVEHSRVPDAVHAISVLRPVETDPDSDIAIFQASSAILSNLGHDNVADRIVASQHLKGLKIRFLMAGVATSHDSAEDFERIIARIKRAAPETDVEVIQDRRPFDLSDHIARAKVVIGTSLHVRILACAYGVARVTLSRTKPTRYARAWDPDMPFDVSLDGIDDAVGVAIANADQPEVVERAAELSRLAHDNLTDLADRVLKLAAAETDSDRTARLQARKQYRTDAERQPATAAGKAATRIADLEAELASTKAELAAIKRSRSYRLARRASRFVRTIRPAR